MEEGKPKVYSGCLEGEWLADSTPYNKQPSAELYNHGGVAL